MMAQRIHLHMWVAIVVIIMVVVLVVIVIVVVVAGGLIRVRAKRRSLVTVVHQGSVTDCFLGVGPFL